MIRGLEKLGLVWDVKLPDLTSQSREHGADGPTRREEVAFPPRCQG